MNEQNTKTYDDESVEESQGLEALPESSLAIYREEIDVQISTAHRFPRSIDTFAKRASNMVSLDKETAESCIYRRPVGKDPDTGKQKIAEGMSIRMAEIVGACYGNLRVSARIVEQTPKYVKVEAIGHDLESNYAAKAEVIESTVNKYGKPYSERMRITVAKAALAKAHRDATFKIVPRALCKPVLKKAYQVIAGGKTLEERRATAHEYIKTLNIDEKRVWATLDVKGLGDIGESHLFDLLGLKTAIEDNDTTIDEAFPPLQNQTSDEQAKSKTETIADKIKSKAEQST